MLRMEQFGFHWTDFDENFMFSAILESLPGKLKFHENLTKITGTSLEDVFTFMKMSR
jgi:hypothetical protein